HQAAVSGDAADRIGTRQQALGAELIDAAPEIEMFERARREILALGDVRETGAALDQHDRKAAHAQVDREPHPDRPAADNDHLISLLHHLPRSTIAPRAFLDTIAPRNVG